MNLKIGFVLLTMFSLVLLVDASAMCCYSSGVCNCHTYTSCTYTCDLNYYNCNGIASDGCETGTPCNHYAFQRYTFNLSAYTLSNIKSITYCFRGYYSSTGSGTAYLEYYNVTSSSWVYDQPISSSILTICHTFTSITDVVDAASNLTQFAARGYTGDSGTVGIDADMVNLTVNYGSGSIILWTSGKFGNALSFDGTGSYATASDSSNLNITGSLTVEAWVKPSTTAPAYQTILQKATATDENYGLFLKGSEVYFEWINSGAKNVQTTSANLQPNTWYHIAAVFNYPSSYVKIYINGVQNASSSPSADLTTNNGNLLIGNDYANSYPFNGTIDEVAVYSRAKSASEIYADANSMFVSLNIKDSLSSSVSARGATSGYINPGANNTLYLTTNNNGNLNMTAGDYAGTYSLRLYINNTKANLLLTTIQQGVSSMQAILPIQLQLYQQIFNNLIIASK